MTDDIRSKDNVGEVPFEWPDTIKEADGMTDANKIEDEISYCRICSHRHRLCKEHEQITDAYTAAVGDVLTLLEDIRSDDEQ